jgi:isoleucyl-tRNA synthetase
MYTTSEEREEALERDIKVDNILDQWILARLNLLIQHVTDGLESYQIDKAAKPLVGFIDDLSTWYVRRSRDRIRGDEGDDRNQSIKMTLYVLQEVSKVLAPFMPFLAETLYQDVTLGQGEESVHLADWPQPTEEVSTDDVLLKDMAVLREAASHAHDLRSQAELKVRQPLALLTLRDDRLKGKVELLDILADEVNVQKIDFDGSIDQPAELDTDLTDDLKRKGVVRECIRSIQRLRKQADLDTAEMITLAVDTDTDGKKLLEDHLDEITQTANLSEISFTTVKEGAEVAEHNFTFRMEVL